MILWSCLLGVLVLHTTISRPFLFLSTSILFLLDGTRFHHPGTFDGRVFWGPGELLQFYIYPHIHEDSLFSRSSFDTAAKYAHAYSDGSMADQ